MLQLLYCHSSSCSYIYCSFRARFIVTARIVCCRVYITVRCPYVCLTACLSVPFVDFCSSVLRFFSAVDSTGWGYRSTAAVGDGARSKCEQCDVFS